MKLVDDEDVETMIAHYCLIGNANVEPDELFVELTDMESIQNVTPLSQ